MLPECLTTPMNNYPPIPEPAGKREVQEARGPRRQAQRLEVPEQEQEQDQLAVGGRQRTQPQVRLRQQPVQEEGHGHAQSLVMSWARIPEG